MRMASTRNSTTISAGSNPRVFQDRDLGGAAAHDDQHGIDDADPADQQRDQAHHHHHIVDALDNILFWSARSVVLAYRQPETGDPLASELIHLRRIRQPHEQFCGLPRYNALEQRRRAHVQVVKPEQTGE